MDLTKILKNVTPEQAEAIRQALDQFVENGLDYLGSQDVVDSKQVAQVREASTVLDLLNGELASLAE